VGDKVRAGQLCAELDSTDYRIRVQQAEASLTQARAQARNASANYDRVRALYENANASRRDLDAARTAYESANAAIQAAEKQLELARLQLGYCRLTAPLNGSIASIDVEVNENVQPGRKILTLTSGSQIEVKVSIPDVLISLIDETQKVSVKFDAIADKEFTATITEVGVASAGMGTAYPVTVRLDQSDPGILPGMAAAVDFRFESEDARLRLVVPSHAVGEDRGGRFVFIVESLPDQVNYGIVRRKLVSVGELTAEGLEIFSGLDDGDMVITAGISHIVEGQKVKLQK